MRILFLHRSFPGQFRYLATVLAHDLNNEVAFLTSAEARGITGVNKVVYRPARQVHPATHPYLKAVENAVLYGQAAFRAAVGLKRRGFVPDVILAHSGWGPSLFIQDVYPSTPLVSYFEWYYHAHGSSFDFDPRQRLSGDDKAEIRVKNTPILFDLVNCAAGISPTEWQRSRLPAEFRAKVHTIHDGIDTDFFRPGADPELGLPELGLDLAQLPEVVTYVATGMEPLRGFGQFMEAVSLLHKRRPRLHAVVVGEDRVEYSAPLPGGKTYKQDALDRFSFDLSRLHFTGRLNVEEFRRVLLASSVHVYLTYPFILSWSVLEAMACGCLVIGSDTPPVREIIENGVNGALVDFFAPRALADKVEEALDNTNKAALLRRRARETILAKYDVRSLLPRQAALLQAVAGRTGG